MRRARHCPRLARPGRLRRQWASPRLVTAALRASPVSASPDTGLRTAPCTTVRTGADSTASVSGSVLRTTACGSGRFARHSVAVSAPLRRVPRRRFPLHECSPVGFVAIWTPFGVSALTPDAARCKARHTGTDVPSSALEGPREALRGQDDCGASEFRAGTRRAPYPRHPQGISRPLLSITDMRSCTARLHGAWRCNTLSSQFDCCRTPPNLPAASTVRARLPPSPGDSAIASAGRR